MIKNFMSRTIMLALLLSVNFLYAHADKYVIYPIPRSITMNNGSLTMTSKVSVVFESTIDPMTKKRLADIMAQHGIESVEGTADSGNVILRLGTVGSGEEVETYSYETLELKKESIMLQMPCMVIGKQRIMFISW